MSPLLALLIVVVMALQGLQGRRDRSAESRQGSETKEDLSWPRCQGDEFGVLMRKLFTVKAHGGQGLFAPKGGFKGEHCAPGCLKR